MQAIDTIGLAIASTVGVKVVTDFLRLVLGSHILSPTNVCAMSDQGSNNAIRTPANLVWTRRKHSYHCSLMSIRINSVHDDYASLAALATWGCAS
jgi:hypothetical protein